MMFMLMPTITADVWAIASTMVTPGMTGSPGKWPWKCGSLQVTILTPTPPSWGTMSRTRSMNRNG